jgi:hypothetical protein
MIGVRPDNRPGRRLGSDPAGLVVRFQMASNWSMNDGQLA